MSNTSISEQLPATTTTSADQGALDTNTNEGIDSAAVAALVEKLVSERLAAAEKKASRAVKQAEKAAPTRKSAEDASPEVQLAALREQLSAMQAERENEKAALRREKAALKVQESLAGKVNPTAARLITKDVLEKVSYSDADGEAVIVDKTGNEVLLADYVAASLKSEYAEFVIVKPATTAPRRNESYLSSTPPTPTSNKKLTENDIIAIMMNSK